MIQPTGHTPDDSGLQNHSVSGLYPFIILYRLFTRTWEVSHQVGVTRSSPRRLRSSAMLEGGTDMIQIRSHTKHRRSLPAQGKTSASGYEIAQSGIDAARNYRP